MGECLKSSKELEGLTAYTVEQEESLADLNGLGVLLRHKKSGARIAVISNEDKNKVFCISFRTPPENSTGVPHIIEHTVLCGSDKFPAKDPFIELAKGSLNTFLNAMTSSDSTMYPVASCNDKDFKNLMHVYMDAVFHPNIYKHEEIFKQEGWHYELENEDAELKYNGIVYSEMKGAFSSPESVLWRQIQNSLFPDTTYGVESGGDPDFIPELTYEQFLDFHRRYYHPSNSYIYLYGNVDAVERLEWLDKEYLSHFDNQPVDSAIRFQKPFGERREVVREYSVNTAEEEANATYLAYNVVVDASLDQVKSLAFEVLNTVLIDAPGAPLKKALLDAGIGEDIFSSYQKDVLQPYFSVVVKNTEPEKKEAFLQVMEETLKKCAEEGLNENSLRAAINKQEFQYREADFGRFPKGLLYGLQMMDSWLYDDSTPFLFLHGNEAYDELKKKIGTGYYEALIRDSLLNGTHASLLQLSPKAGLNAQKEAKLKETLAAYKASLSKEQVKELVEQTRHLKEYQDTPSTKEELLSIPLLAREDIEKKAEPLVNAVKELNGVKTLHQEIYTNGIAYVTLLFDVKKCPERLLPYVGLLTNVLGMIDTAKHSYLELSNEINIHTGGISFSTRGTRLAENVHDYRLQFTVTAKALYEKLPETVSFIREIISETDFTDERHTRRLQEIVLEQKSRYEMLFNSNGTAAAVMRAGSYYDEVSCYDQLTRGITQYAFIAELAKNFEEKKAELVLGLKEAAAYIWGKDNLIINLTAEEEGFKQLAGCADSLLSVLPKQVQGTEEVQLKPEKKNEGFITPGQVQFAVMAGNFRDAGVPYTGALTVLNTILGYDYLWNNIRVKGGAYGAMCDFQPNGNSYLGSYRDPNLKTTYETFRHTPDYIRAFSADEREMTKYIIGTMSNVDVPLTPNMAGARSMNAYLAGRSYEDIQKERDEILATGVEEIRATAAAVEALLAQNYVCTLGTEQALRENEETFASIQSLMR